MFKSHSKIIDHERDMTKVMDSRSIKGMSRNVLGLFKGYSRSGSHRREPRTVNNRQLIRARLPRGVPRVRSVVCPGGS